MGFCGCQCMYSRRTMNTTTPINLLPPANEVWGKVMFYKHVLFCPRRGGGDWLPTMHHRSHDWGSASGRGVYIWERGLHQGRVCIRGVASPPPPYQRYMGYYGIRSASGRYASYLNAFFFLLILLRMVAEAIQCILTDAKQTCPMTSLSFRVNES